MLHADVHVVTLCGAGSLAEAGNCGQTNSSGIVGLGPVVVVSANGLAVLIHGNANDSDELNVLAIHLENQLRMSVVIVGFVIGYVLDGSVLGVSPSANEGQLAVDNLCHIISVSMHAAVNTGVAVLEGVGGDHAVGALNGLSSNDVAGSRSNSLGHGLAACAGPGSNLVSDAVERVKANVINIGAGGRSCGVGAELVSLGGGLSLVSRIPLGLGCATSAGVILVSANAGLRAGNTGAPVMAGSLGQNFMDVLVAELAVCLDGLIGGAVAGNVVANERPTLGVSCANSALAEVVGHGDDLVLVGRYLILVTNDNKLSVATAAAVDILDTGLGAGSRFALDCRDGVVHVMAKSSDLNGLLSVAGLDGASQESSTLISTGGLNGYSNQLPLVVSIICAANGEGLLADGAVVGLTLGAVVVGGDQLPAVAVSVTRVLLGYCRCSGHVDAIGATFNSTGGAVGLANDLLGAASTVYSLDGVHDTLERLGGAYNKGSCTGGASIKDVARLLAGCLDLFQKSRGTVGGIVRLAFAGADGRSGLCKRCHRQGRDDHQADQQPRYKLFHDCFFPFK